MSLCTHTHTHNVQHTTYAIVMTFTTSKFMPLFMIIKNVPLFCICFHLSSFRLIPSVIWQKLKKQNEFLPKKPTLAHTHKYIQMTVRHSLLSGRKSVEFNYFILFDNTVCCHLPVGQKFACSYSYMCLSENKLVFWLCDYMKWQCIIQLEWTISSRQK